MRRGPRLPRSRPRQSRGTGRLAPFGEYLYGTHPVMAALSVGAAAARGVRPERRVLHALYVMAGADGGTAAAEAARSAGVEVYRDVERHDMNMMAGNRPHNGVVLDASPLEPEFVPLLDRPGLWVALDQVTDPQNLGAVLRSALFFGATGAVVSTKNCAPLSPAASKASSGAMELLPVLSCNSMPKFLRATKGAAPGEGAAWNVVGLSSSGVPHPGSGSRMLGLPADAAALAADVAAAPTVVVVGSEGAGMRALVEAQCTHLAHIAKSPLAVDDAGLLDSLNASTSVATLLYAATALRR